MRLLCVLVLLFLILSIPALTTGAYQAGAQGVNNTPTPGLVAAAAEPVCLMPMADLLLSCNGGYVRAEYAGLLAGGWPNVQTFPCNGLTPLQLVAGQYTLTRVVSETQIFVSAGLQYSVSWP
jgi:hypothetical protein